MSGYLATRQQSDLSISHLQPHLVTVFTNRNMPPKMVLALLFPIKLCLSRKQMAPGFPLSVWVQISGSDLSLGAGCTYISFVSEQFICFNSNQASIHSQQSTSILHLASTSTVAGQEGGFYQAPSWAFLSSPPCQSPSHLADLHHIQLCLQTRQCGIIMATGTLGHSAPLLTLGIIAAHEEDGHHPTCRRGEQGVHIIYGTSHSFSKSKVMNQNPFPSLGVKGPWACDGFTASAPIYKAEQRASMLCRSPAQDLRLCCAD